MDICSYFRSTSKYSVVSSCSDSEDGNESEIDVQSSHLPRQDLESGDKTKNGKKFFPG